MPIHFASTRAITLCFGRNPQVRLSNEFVRLSPTTKYMLSGTNTGVNVHRPPMSGPAVFAKGSVSGMSFTVARQFESETLDSPTAMIRLTYKTDGSAGNLNTTMSPARGSFNAYDHALAITKLPRASVGSIDTLGILNTDMPVMRATGFQEGVLKGFQM